MGRVIPIQPGISWLYAMIVMILKLLISWIFVISRRWETSPVSPAKKADEADPHLANMGLPRAVTTSCRMARCPTCKTRRRERSPTFPAKLHKHQASPAQKIQRFKGPRAPRSNN